MDDANGPKATVDLTLSFYQLSCGVCGSAFCVTSQFYVDRAADSRSFGCPNGHQNTAHLPAEPSGPWLKVFTSQLAELHQLRHRARFLETELAKLSPSKPGEPVNDAEVKRRAGILAERSELTAYGRRLCKVCGKPSSRLRKHLITAHSDHLREMPAIAFA